MKRMIFSLIVLASMFVVPRVSNAEGRHTRECSNASLRGAYGFFVSAIILPASTPRSIIGRIIFDGAGNFTNALTFNDNGVVAHSTDAGTYTVDSDCTGKLFTNGGTRTIEIVLVDGGQEYYELRTDDPSILFRFNTAKKQFPSDSGEDRR